MAEQRTRHESRRVLVGIAVLAALLAVAFLVEDRVPIAPALVGGALGGYLGYGLVRWLKARRSD